jgi:hypothetical protein
MSDDLDAFLARIATIEPEQARRMRLAWEMADPAPRREAWAAATERLREAGREDELAALRAAVNEWAGDSATASMDNYWGGNRELDRVQTRRNAMPPVLDAGLATIARTLLDVDTRWILEQPFRAGITGETRRGPVRRGRRPSTRG